MFYEIKDKIDKELAKFIKDIDKRYSLGKISPLLFKHLKEFVLRKGKRIRPILFVMGYCGFANKTPPNLYTSAIAIELLHDFMLVHDDIIDKSDTRRGKPSMHAMFNKYLANKKDNKFCGQDLAIVAGDVLYAIAINAFLSVKEDMLRKEKALKKFAEATMYTGSGEFMELLYGIKNLNQIKKEDILKVYDLKTAYYTFAYPLSIGATLAGARDNQINKLFRYGTYLGRAFQIKDDVISMFGKEKEIGKSALTDLKEAKKTLLIWQAYNHTNENNKQLIKRIFSKRNVNKKDLLKLQKIIVASGTLDYVRGEISQLIKKAQTLIETTAMKRRHKEFLNTYIKELLNI
jgi:geranylgeranyl diphosphate synthase type I